MYNGLKVGDSQQLSCRIQHRRKPSIRTVELLYFPWEFQVGILPIHRGSSLFRHPSIPLVNVVTRRFMLAVRASGRADQSLERRWHRLWQESRESDRSKRSWHLVCVSFCFSCGVVGFWRSLTASGHELERDALRVSSLAVLWFIREPLRVTFQSRTVSCRKVHDP